MRTGCLSLYDVNNGYVHLGIFNHRHLIGVMQWGYALNPNNGRRIVIDTNNRDYIGSHETTFYHLDGEWYHEINKTAIKRGGKRGQYLRENFHRATAHKFKQYRYIKFLQRAARKRLNTALFKIQPYPKPNKPTES